MSDADVRIEELERRVAHLEKYLGLAFEKINEGAKLQFSTFLNGLPEDFLDRF